MNSASARKRPEVRYQRRYLALRNIEDGGVLKIRCTHETLGNYWGYPVGAQVRKEQRYYKPDWEVQVDESRA